MAENEELNGVKALGESFELGLVPGDEVTFLVNGEVKKGFVTGNYAKVRVYINMTAKA